jgi:hypothetical protein
MLTENERLTYLKGQGFARAAGPYSSRRTHSEISNRLALYENTKYKPDEIITLFNECAKQTARADALEETVSQLLTEIDKGDAGDALC